VTTADPADVRVEIDTYLDGPEISSIIKRIERDIDREMDNPPAGGTDDRQDLEAVLTAIHIATTRDRAESKASSGRTSATYEESMVDQLRSRAQRLGAPDSLIGINAGKPSFSLNVPDTSNP
jgi:predicted RNA methylase